MTEKQTPEGLPAVSEDTIYSLNRDVESKVFNLTKAYHRIEQDNPHLAEFIKIRAQLGGMEARDLSTAIGIYELLRRQAESNQLERRL